MATSKPDGTRKWRITTLISGSGSNLQALLDALPPSSPLSHCQITSVLSSRSDAFGLQRARSASPSVPAEAFPLLRWKKARGGDGQRSEWEQDLAAKIRATRPDLVVLAGWMLILGEGFLNALVRDWDEPASSSPSSDGASMLDRLPPAGVPDSVDPTGASVGNGLETPGSSPYDEAVRAGLKGRRIPIINLHPALPGQFPGAHAILDAYNAFNIPSESTLRSSSTSAASTLESLAPSSASSELADSTASSASSSTQPRRITKTGIMIHRVIPLLDAGAPVIVKEVPMVEGESLAELEERIHKVEHVGIVEAVGKITGEMLRGGEWWESE
ncbi:hypothetical protein JCM10207_005640 [Rhodosporidiobolus poonsookiae]